MTVTFHRHHPHFHPRQADLLRITCPGAMISTMKSDYWIRKWVTGDIRFHQETYEPNLPKYFPKLTPTTVFVPLCGKTKDMIWFAEQGHQVIGVELSELATEAFFSENKILFKKRLEGEHTLYQSENITIWRGDFFGFPLAAFKKVGAIYDRAALIALPEDMRRSYAQKIKELCGSVGPLPLLLTTLVYEQDKVIGPPFSVSHEEVSSLYSDRFQIEVLAEQKSPPQTTGNPKFEGVAVQQNVYLLHS